MEINLRPHHFLCTLCFQGKGYSDKFINNYALLVTALSLPEGNNQVIKIVNHTDSICAPCPNKRGTQCETEEKITGLDMAHAEALQIQGDTEITWQEAKERIKTHISLTTFHTICATCSWKELGICESVLTQFLS